MDLNPVVHNNDALSFEASGQLTSALASLQGRLVTLIAALWWVAFSRSVNLFNFPGKSTLAYVITQAILLVVAVLVSVYQIKRVSSIVITIGRRVTITNDMISVIPFSFGLFFWTRNSRRHLDFKIAELKIRKTDNPLWFTSALDNRVFQLRDKTNEAYIVFDFFDKTLKERLMEILVEVTPPELLIPGRLRHY